MPTRYKLLLDLHTHWYPVSLMRCSSSRRHRSPWLEHFFKWEQMPVTLSQASMGQCDRCKCDTPHLSRGHQASIGLSRIRRTREQQASAKPAFVFRVNCRKALSLDVTPLLIPAAAIFADDMGASVRAALRLSSIYLLSKTHTVAQPGISFRCTHNHASTEAAEF